MGLNKVMLIIINKFHYSIAHMLIKPPQNLTQLILGQGRGVKFCEFTGNLLIPAL